jgi:hypothetical protein
LADATADLQGNKHIYSFDAFEANSKGTVN